MVNRHNKIFKDMEGSMISHFSLPNLLWSETLRPRFIYSTKFLVKQLTKSCMSYGQVKSLVLGMFTSEVVQLTQGFINLMKENWI